MKFNEIVTTHHLSNGLYALLSGTGAGSCLVMHIPVLSGTIVKFYGVVTAHHLFDCFFLRFYLWFYLSNSS